MGIHTNKYVPRQTHHHLDRFQNSVDLPVSLKVKLSWAHISHRVHIPWQAPEL
jgi:hypothetical protein